jgi:hypothetical protein
MEERPLNGAEYAITNADVAALRKLHASQIPPPKWSIGALILVSVLAAIPIIYFVFIWPFESRGAHLELALLVIVLGGLGIPALLTIAAAIPGEGKFRSKRESGQHFVRAIVSPNGLQVDDQACQRTYRWNAIRKIESTESHAFFYLDAMTAVIIPQRAFPDANAFARFIKSARTYLAISHAAGRNGFDATSPTAEPALIEPELTHYFE